MRRPKSSALLQLHPSTIQSRRSVMPRNRKRLSSSCFSFSRNSSSFLPFLLFNFSFCRQLKQLSFTLSSSHFSHKHSVWNTSSDSRKVNSIFQLPFGTVVGAPFFYCEGAGYGFGEELRVEFRSEVYFLVIDIFLVQLSDWQSGWTTSRYKTLWLTSHCDWMTWMSTKKSISHICQTIPLVLILNFIVVQSS